MREVKFNSLEDNKIYYCESIFSGNVYFLVKRNELTKKYILYENGCYGFIYQDVILTDDKFFLIEDEKMITKLKLKGLV
jgi:hypothetical protein